MIGIRGLVSLVGAVALVGLAAAQRPFDVRVVGKGRPVLLIPGLSCPGSVWDATVERLKSRYECHVLTLPGFAKQPPIAGPFLPQVRDSIIAYVKEKHLDHPAVIGHSLGGFMTYYLGSTEPDLFGPLVAVDGVPWLGALIDERATVESVKPQADALENAMAKGSRNQFRSMNLMALKSQMLDPKQAEKVGELSGESDMATVGRAAREMLLTDLRADVAKIKSPILLLAAGEWAKTPEQRAELKRSYEVQIAKAPHAKLVVAEKARHFIMLDDPAFFYGAVESFLEEAWSKR